LLDSRSSTLRCGSGEHRERGRNSPQAGSRALDRGIDQPALVADGYHARTDGFVSLGVMASAALVAVGLPLADPVIAIVITAIILGITWQSWLTVRGRAHAH
jgi:hypothetical protein